MTTAPEGWSPDPDLSGTFAEDRMHATAVTAAAPPQEDPMTMPTPEAAPTDGPTHAGLAVQAADTARVLMIQRALDQDDAPDVLGTWEFPGGGVEDGDQGADQQAVLLAAAQREFTEETGLPVPPGEVTGGWGSPDGVYQGFVWTTPTESGAFTELNPDLAAAEAINPDDPQRRNPDVSAWWTVDGIQGAGPVIRPEVLASTDWDQFAAPVDPAVIAEAAPDIPDDEELDDQGMPEVEAATLEASGAPLQAADAPMDPQVPEDAPAPAGTPEKAQDIAPDGNPFYGIMCPEGVTSGDDRQFGIGAMTWRDLPLPLMAQDAQAPGHDGAVRVGRIDSIWRDDTTYAKPMIRYTGVWDTSPAALEAERQVEAGVARGVSVDGDQVTTRLLDSSGTELDPMTDDTPADGVVVEHADAARACGATICSVPAFQQAYIANGTLEARTEPEPGQAEVETQDTPMPADAPMAPMPEGEVAVAAAAQMAPAWTLGLVASVSDDDADWVLPASHFADPQLEGPTALTVTEDGRVYGHLALWGSCHLNGAAGRRGEQVKAAGKCMEVPMSASNYAYFATGQVRTDDGGRVNVGQLTMDTSHASLLFSARDTTAHYDQTGTAVADVTIGHDLHGIWFSGHLRPTATKAQVHALTASGSVSGDWREVVRGSRQLELVAALVVNVPGYPIGRPAVTAAAGGPIALVASGAITPQTMAARVAYPTEWSVDDFAAQVLASLDRMQHARRVHARARTQHATALVARVSERIS